MNLRTQTQYGTVEGVTEESVSAFLGIPYGAAMVGEDRFRPTRRPEPWSGIREAKTWGPRSFQSLALNPLHVAFPHTFAAIVGDDLANDVSLSEDCLTVNVWTPRAPGSGRPVLVWLHGGGSNGSPSESRSDGNALAGRGDVVVISVTHRLNVFGYLDLRSVAGEEYAASGSTGLLDLVLALEWVRDNVANFGGDPGNVTIFGESAGGAKVACLMSMPEARGLFHKAVIQSGADTAGGLSCGADAAQSFAADLLTELDLTRDSWREVLQVPGPRLVAAHEGVSAKRGSAYVLPPPGPTIGDVLSHTPIDAVENGEIANIPLLVGACADELELFTMRRDYLAEEPGEDRTLELGDAGPRPLAPSGEDELRRWLGEGADEIIAAYKRSRPDAEGGKIEAAIRGDRQFLIPSLRFVEAFLRIVRSPVFFYSFAWKSDLAPQLGAFHSFDIPFFFDRTEAIPLASGDRTAAPLAANMAESLIAFARTGAPSHDGIPEWLPYNPKTRPTMIFDRECRLEYDPRRVERTAWEGIPTSRLGF